jgi:hypothetical protein
MNVCDYYVKQVATDEPVYRGEYKEEDGTEWWEVVVSYYYDNGELKMKTLTFPTKSEALKVKKGYHFTA